MCWLTSASIPYVWPNVAQNVNNKLYITERNRLFSSHYPYQLQTVYETYAVSLTSFNYENVTELAAAAKIGLKVRIEPAEGQNS